ncbi:uncharacterized protein LOC119434368, partial [Dermacentor silvarum]|uniref:uncharacterized protein LOC119434368 n=1 Tax=Dermacentor silvarum TaxID=543639 RepID=UPI001899F20C
MAIGVRIANKLTEDTEKRAALLSCCGEETFSLTATLVKPLRPPNADYEPIVEAVKNHINPKPSELYSRYVFSKRDQHDGESVADYVTALRKLSESCGFSDKQLPLDTMLSDRLVFGISDSTVQQRLLAEKNLAFTTAYDLAVTAESAAKHQRGLPQVAAYLNDILVASETVEEHHKVLMEVFDRLSKAQLCVQGAKCQFFKESLDYLGHRIDGRGIYPSKSKVDAIHEAPTPQNKKELQAFL